MCHSILLSNNAAPWKGSINFVKYSAMSSNLEYFTMFLVSWFNKYSSLFHNFRQFNDWKRGIAPLKQVSVMVCILMLNVSHFSDRWCSTLSFWSRVTLPTRLSMWPGRSSRQPYTRRSTIWMSCTKLTKCSSTQLILGALRYSHY